ncbi:MAG TPA: glucosidase, partial [Phycisphaerae bacterium]|nr:glucosidase [Phycisphaerae bacterium]
MNPEAQRLHTPRAREDWKTWGPYLSERAWGTVREDYSADGNAWNYFPHDHARSRAYRWNEDGILGISDRRQLLCFAPTFWNGKDPILKERFFGLNGHEGNHGEDVKEYFFFLDSSPTHSYMKALYKYPQAAFPYDGLVAENARRGRAAPEYELIDTGIFDENRYFDIEVEYAKAGPEDILIRITAHNRGPDAADLWILPTLWFRNTWSWQKHSPRPNLNTVDRQTLVATQRDLGRLFLRFDLPNSSDPLLFTENETNCRRLFNAPNAGPFCKDAFHRFLIHNEKSAVNPAGTGTKAAVSYRFNIPAGKSATVRLRLAAGDHAPPAPDAAFDALIEQRRAECDQFYAELKTEGLSPDLANIQRQAFAGLLWSKQFYYYDVRTWLQGDPNCPTPPAARWGGRNHDWLHLTNDSVMSMPDPWEYPWYAAWDLAFHTIPLALVDPDFAKRQLLL